MEKMSELKPCPFCGEKAKIQRMDHGTCQSNFYETYRITCTKCSISKTITSIFHLENGQLVFNANGYLDIIEAWNRRSE